MTLTFLHLSQSVTSLIDIINALPPHSEGSFEQNQKIQNLSLGIIKQANHLYMRVSAEELSLFLTDISILKEKINARALKELFPNLFEIQPYEIVNCLSKTETLSTLNSAISSLEKLESVLLDIYIITPKLYPT